MLDYEVLVKALGWREASPNRKDYEWRTPDHYGVTPNLMGRMLKIRFHQIPLKLSHVHWSCTENEYQMIVVPFLSKRLELGI